MHPRIVAAIFSALLDRFSLAIRARPHSTPTGCDAIVPVLALIGDERKVLHELDLIALSFQTLLAFLGRLFCLNPLLYFLVSPPDTFISSFGIDI